MHVMCAELILHTSKLDIARIYRRKSQLYFHCKFNTSYVIHTSVRKVKYTK
jgi:hypothetical protein